MFFFDPLYLILMAPAFLFVMIAQWAVKRAYSKWSQIGNTRRISGGEAARVLLNQGGLLDVHLEGTAGELTDHYDPRNNILRLSPGVGNGRSVASLAIAAHEIGHAMQDKTNYGLLRLRSAMVPAVNIGSNLGYFMIFGGLILATWIGLTELGSMLAWVGVAGFGLSALFALATLPVEFDASRRALQMLDASGMLVTQEERNGARAVLRAAALTYIAALGAALAQLLYYVMLVGGIGGRRD